VSETGASSQGGSGRSIILIVFAIVILALVFFAAGSYKSRQAAKVQPVAEEPAPEPEAAAPAAEPVVEPEPTAEAEPAAEPAPAAEAEPAADPEADSSEDEGELGRAVNTPDFNPFTF
jgi:flagellar basal body-associated protein FliL